MNGQHLINQTTGEQKFNIEFDMYEMMIMQAALAAYQQTARFDRMEQDYKSSVKKLDTDVSDFCLSKEVITWVLPEQERTVCQNTGYYSENETGSLKFDPIEKWVLMDALAAYLITQDERDENYPAVAERLKRYISGESVPFGK